MATRHNRRFIAAHRRQQVTEMYLQGRSQAEIAETLGVVQSTVCADLERVRKDWQASAHTDYAEIRVREVEKLNLIEKEAWAAWQRSQKPAQSAVVTGEGIEQRARKTLKNQVGDPRFLDQVNKAIAQRRALQGLDLAPVMITPEDRADAVSLELRRERIIAMLALFGHRDRTEGTGAASGDGQPGDVGDGRERRALEAGPPCDVPRPDDHGGD
jgi:Putative ATPase subunit of terminase (gpP-like)